MKREATCFGARIIRALPIVISLATSFRYSWMSRGAIVGIAPSGDDSGMTEDSFIMAARSSGGTRDDARQVAAAAGRSMLFATRGVDGVVAVGS